MTITLAAPIAEVRRPTKDAERHSEGRSEARIRPDSRPRAVPGPRLVPVPDCEPPLEAARDYSSQGQALIPAQRAALQMVPARAPERLIPAVPVEPIVRAPLIAYHRWAGRPAATQPFSQPRPVPLPPAAPPATAGRSALPRQRSVRQRIVSVAQPYDGLYTAVTRADSREPRISAEVAGTTLARAVLEVLSGRRPRGQLEDRCAVTVYAALEDFPRLSPATRLLSQWICEPKSGIAEVSCAFQCSSRTRAMALQLQARGGDWRITALQIA